MFKRIFWNGLKVFAPVVLTIAIVIWTFRNIEAFFGHFLQYFIPHQYYFDGLGIIIGVVLIFLLGLLVNAWVIRGVYQLADDVVHRIPLIKTVYTAIQDLLLFFDPDRAVGQKAVMLETKFGKMIGFVTKEDFEDQPELNISDKEVMVYVPLSYQIGGLLLMVPKMSLEPIDMPVNQAMSLVVTAGLTGNKKKKPKG